MSEASTEIDADPAKARILELETEIATLKDEFSAEIREKEGELSEARAAYEARLLDIAELGNSISALEQEVARQEVRYSNERLRQQVLSQLESPRAELQAVLKQKRRFGRSRSAVLRVEQDVDLVAQSDLFDAEWYLAFYTDIASAGCNPALHFVTDGAYELRNPGPMFDSLEYHKTYPDVAAGQMPAFIHYLRNGRLENRQTFPVGEQGLTLRTRFA